MLAAVFLETLKRDFFVTFSKMVSMATVDGASLGGAVFDGALLLHEIDNLLPER